MPAALVPHAAIPELATRVDPEMLNVLRQLQKADFILNAKHLDAKVRAALERLEKLGLVDPAFEGNERARPFMWVGNGNGSRVLGYKTGIRGGPHYEVPAPELAAWLREQGPDRCWNVDGDPLLTGRLTFPCRADRLSNELRAINRPLLVQAKKDDVTARGQVIGKAKIDAVVDRLADNIHLTGDGDKPLWAADRVLYLCWKGSTDEWLLAEDNETTALMQGSEEGDGKGSEASEKK
jgi:hypothetical protein